MSKKLDWNNEGDRMEIIKLLSPYYKSPGFTSIAPKKIMDKVSYAGNYPLWIAWMFERIKELENKLYHAVSH